AIFACVAFLLFYTFITAVLQDHIDQELRSEARRFSTLLASEGVEAINNSAIIEAQAAGVKKVFFRFLNLNGAAFSSSNMSYWKDIPVNGAAIEQLSRDENAVFETIIIPNRSDQVRILYALLSPLIVAQVGQAMESQSRFVEAFRRIFIVT